MHFTFDRFLFSFCTEWLQTSIFSGGLQTSQIHYNYNEEKDEDHCSSLGTTNPDKTKLYSHRITLSDHAQPFLQAIADNNTQDHTVKVQAGLNFLKGISDWLNIRHYLINNYFSNKYKTVKILQAVKFL